MDLQRVWVLSFWPFIVPTGTPPPLKKTPIPEHQQKNPGKLCHGSVKEWNVHSHTGRLKSHRSGWNGSGEMFQMRWNKSVSSSDPSSQPGLNPCHNSNVEESEHDTVAGERIDNDLPTHSDTHTLQRKRCMKTWSESSGGRRQPLRTRPRCRWHFVLSQIWQSSGRYSQCADVRATFSRLSSHRAKIWRVWRNCDNFGVAQNVYIHFSFGLKAQYLNPYWGDLLTLTR